MPTGYEVEMYRNIARIEAQLARIANALEQQVYGVTGSQLAKLKRQMAEDERRVAIADELAEE